MQRKTCFLILEINFNSFPVQKKKSQKNSNFKQKKGFRRQDKGNVWFIICDQVTTLCLQLNDSYKTQIIFFYLENNSDSLNRPPNTNLINVHCMQAITKYLPHIWGYFPIFLIFHSVLNDQCLEHFHIKDWNFMK